MKPINLLIYYMEVPVSSNEIDMNGQWENHNATLLPLNIILCKLHHACHALSAKSRARFMSLFDILVDRGDKLF